MMSDINAGNMDNVRQKIDSILSDLSEMQKSYSSVNIESNAVSPDPQNVQKASDSLMKESK